MKEYFTEKKCIIQSYLWTEVYHYPDMSALFNSIRNLATSHSREDVKRGKIIYSE